MAKEMTMSWENPPSRMKRIYDKARVQGLGDLATFWHEHMLPGHFEPGAEAKYGYATRSAKYLRRKQREKGHQNPLVWSGASQRKMLAQQPIPQQSTKGMQMVYRGLPRHFFIKRNSKKFLEAITVTKEEANRLVEVWETTAAREIAAAKEKKETR